MKNKYLYSSVTQKYSADKTFQDDLDKKYDLGYYYKHHTSMPDPSDKNSITHCIVYEKITMETLSPT